MGTCPDGVPAFAVQKKERQVLLTKARPSCRPAQRVGIQDAADPTPRGSQMVSITKNEQCRTGEA